MCGWARGLIFAHQRTLRWTEGDEGFGQRLHHFCPGDYQLAIVFDMSYDGFGWKRWGRAALPKDASHPARRELQRLLGGQGWLACWVISGHRRIANNPVWIFNQYVDPFGHAHVHACSFPRSYMPLATNWGWSGLVIELGFEPSDESHWKSRAKSESWSSQWMRSGSEFEAII